MNTKQQTDTYVPDYLNWWNGLGHDGKIAMTNKHFPHNRYYQNSDEEKEQMYLAENPVIPNMPIDTFDWDLYPSNEAGAFDHLDQQASEGDKFTGGEWEVWAELNVQSKDGRAICSCGVNNGNPQSRKENIANAHLISNAPTMYRALKEILRFQSALNEGAEALITPDNFLKAIQEAKEVLNNINNTKN